MTQKCPFCGGEDLEIGRGTKDSEGWPTYICCVTCGAQGPWVYINDAADTTSTNLIAEKTGWNKQYLLAEVERLNRVFANQGNLREEIVELKSQLQAAQALAAQHLANQDYLCALERKRVARECIDYVNNHASDCGCSKRIAHDIRARYGVD